MQIAQLAQAEPVELLQRHERIHEPDARPGVGHVHEEQVRQVHGEHHGPDAPPEPEPEPQPIFSRPSVVPAARQPFINERTQSEVEPEVVLPEAEPEIGAALTGYLEEEGIIIVSGIAYRMIRKTEDGVSLTVTRDGQDVAIDADQVLVATGRTPNIEGLGLAELGVAVSHQGAIIVDDRMRTTKTGVYAAGDVTGRDQFVYMAAHGAKLAARNALNGDTLRYDNSAMPAIVFTDPQVASVGLTEAAARSAGHTIRVSSINLDQVPRALAARDTRGLIKLVADANSGRLLGAHILAPEGADSIQTATLAIRQGLTVDELADTIFPYLTTVEGLKLAALTFAKDIAKLSCCAG